MVIPVDKQLHTCGKPSRGQYNLGCRCYLCTIANSDYEYRRSHGLTVKQFVNAGPVRRHIKKLLASGLTRREICRLAGISRSAIYNILVAHHSTGRPVKRLAIETHRALMAVKPGMHSYGKGTRVPADNFIARVDWLVAHGVRVAEIIRVTGIDRATLYGRHKRTHINALTAKRLMNSWDELTQRIAVPPSGKARNVS